MKKYLLKVLFISIIALPFISCDSDNDDEIPEDWNASKNGVYILNSGNWGKNDASLSHYDPDTKDITKNVFSLVNDLQLGDIAQDMTIYGSKMYLSVTNSNKIYITDLNSKLVKTISPMNDQNQPMEPRFLITHGGKVYATTQDGHVIRIDTTSLSIDNKVKVGSFPEQLTVSSSNIYVANSGQGEDKSVSVINISSFTETKKIELPDFNPVNIIADNNGTIYVNSWGVYNVSAASLYKINTTTEEITTLDDTGLVTNMALNGDRLLLMSLDYMTNETKFSYYDIPNDELVKTSFITDNTTLNALGNSISVDKSNGNIYIGTGDSQSLGRMYIFTSEGKLINQFSTGGYYPMGAFFLSEAK